MAENEAFWRDLLVHGQAERKRALFGALPTDPRCMFCHSPFQGFGSRLTSLIGRGQAREDPRFCDKCLQFSYQHPGGTQLDLAMVFADVRGSTPLAERMGDEEFSDLINRFFRVSAEALVDSGALVGRLAGDEAIGFYVPGIAGPDYAEAALRGVQELLSATGHNQRDGPWIPVGAGVHAGNGFVGLVGSREGGMELTALGDDVNVGARIADEAGSGEILASLSFCKEAGVDVDELEHRTLSLKGKEDPIEVAVIGAD